MLFAENGDAGIFGEGETSERYTKLLCWSCFNSRGKYMYEKELKCHICGRILAELHYNTGVDIHSWKPACFDNPDCRPKNVQVSQFSNSKRKKCSICGREVSGMHRGNMENDEVQCLADPNCKPPIDTWKLIKEAYLEIAAKERYGFIPDTTYTESSVRSPSFQLEIKNSRTEKK